MFYARAVVYRGMLLLLFCVIECKHRFDFDDCHIWQMSRRLIPVLWLWLSNNQCPTQTCSYSRQDICVIKTETRTSLYFSQIAPHNITDKLQLKPGEIILLKVTRNIRYLHFYSLASKSFDPLEFLLSISNWSSH